MNPHPITPRTRPKTLRDLLVAFGIGQFNATMVIPIMLTQPATTDPKQPAVILLVREIQKHLYAMGYEVDNTGYLDEVTAHGISRITGGPHWVNRTWQEVVTKILIARQSGYQFAPAEADAPVDLGPQRSVGAFDLPAVPGGALTYVAGAGLLYYLWKKRKR